MTIESHHNSKNTSILEKLRRQQQQQQQEQEQHHLQQSESQLPTMNQPLSFVSPDEEAFQANKENTGDPHQNVIDCHPDEFAPLKPEEADECQLFEFFQDHDFSFLFDSTTTTTTTPTTPSSSSWSVVVSGHKRKFDETVQHRIPSESDDESDLHSDMNNYSAIHHSHSLLLGRRGKRQRRV